MPETDVIKSKLGSTLKELLKEKGIGVQRIVIFGSFAKGLQREDSDIDVIIVSRDFRNKDIFERVELTTGIGRVLVKMLKKPIDLMFYSDLEWNKGHSLVINAAKAEGEVIYGTP